MLFIPFSVGVIIATTHKTASTAINNSLKVRNVSSLSLEAVIELRKSNWKVIGVVRDPIDRFESAYNFFKYGQCGNFPTGEYESIKEFTDAVLNGVTDTHWQPQSEQLPYCDTYVDLESYPMRYRENSVNHTESATYKLLELKEHYKGDYIIRGNTWQL